MARSWRTARSNSRAWFSATVRVLEGMLDKQRPVRGRPLTPRRAARRRPEQTDLGVRRHVPTARRYPERCRRSEYKKPIALSVIEIPPGLALGMSVPKPLDRRRATAQCNHPLDSRRLAFHRRRVARVSTVQRCSREGLPHAAVIAPPFTAQAFVDLTKASATGGVLEPGSHVSLALSSLAHSSSRLGRMGISSTRPA